MKTGKILVLVGALLTLVSTFFISFGQTNGADGRTLSSGIGFLFNIPEIITDVNYWVAFNGGEVLVINIVSIVLLVFLVSGVIQLAGLANRVVAIIGSIFVLSASVIILLAIFIDCSMTLTSFSLSSNSSVSTLENVLHEYNSVCKTPIIFFDFL